MCVNFFHFPVFIMYVMFSGWSYSGDGHSDSSNSSSNLYPVMMHQNSAAFSSTPVFPTFVPTSGSSSSHHALGHSLPGTSGAANLYANPLPGTSGNIANMDPAGGCWFFSIFCIIVVM